MTACFEKEEEGFWVSGDAYLDDFINHRTFSVHIQENYIHKRQSTEIYRLSNYCIKVLIKRSNLKRGAVFQSQTTCSHRSHYMNSLLFALLFHFSLSHPPTKRAITTDSSMPFDCSNSHS